MKKQGSGLYLKQYQGGFLPLAALIPLIGGILGGVGGAAGGIASAVNSTKSAAEQARHNREIEKIEREKTGLGTKCDCKFKKYGEGLFLGKQR